MEDMYETVNTVVSELLEDRLLRMAETYSIWLYATIKVWTIYVYVTSNSTDSSVIRIGNGKIS